VLRAIGGEEFEIDLYVFRTALNGSLQMFYRIVDVASHELGAADIEVGGGITFVAIERRLELGRGLIGVARSPQRRSQGRMQVSRCRLKLGRASQISNRGVAHSELHPNLGAVSERLRIVWMGFDLLRKAAFPVSQELLWGREAFYVGAFRWR
jgi:hypothetical protein